jgi:hypothetical protein
LTLLDNTGAARLKAAVLTHGVTFTPDALTHARRSSSKELQRVYNAPLGAAPGAPQEIVLTDDDGYRVCVSAVAPVPGREPLTLGVAGDTLTLANGRWSSERVEVSLVGQPRYYSETLPSGQPITRVVSCCGESELNIWPWHDCAVTQLCRFCGINRIQRRSGTGDLMTARDLGRGRSAALEAWFTDLAAAVKIAVDDPVYATELFPMIISGNLPDAALDRQAEIYAGIAREIVPLLGGRPGPEGLVATTAPPDDLAMLTVQAQAGITTMAINLEVYTEEAFLRECPGKARIGRPKYLGALERSVEVFGRGFVWTNFVLGLEPVADLLAGCARLAGQGVVPGASVLHFDEGAAVRESMPPTFDETVRFYQDLAGLYHEHGLRPYFSSRALRSSLANEAYAGRL